MQEGVQDSPGRDMNLNLRGDGARDILGESAASGVTGSGGDNHINQNLLNLNQCDLNGPVPTASTVVNNANFSIQNSTNLSGAASSAVGSQQTGSTKIVGGPGQDAQTEEDNLNDNQSQNGASSGLESSDADGNPEDDLPPVPPPIRVDVDDTEEFTEKYMRVTRSGSVQLDLLHAGLNFNGLMPLPESRQSSKSGIQNEDDLGN